MYQWFVFIHLVGLVLFGIRPRRIGVHARSGLPGQRDRALVADYLETSKLATQTMYIGLGILLLIGGAGAATINGWWTQPSILGSDRSCWSSSSG